MLHHFPSFGAWLALQRGNMSLRDFASALGIDHSQVSRIEHGQSDTTLTTVVHICEGLHLSCCEFFQSWSPQSKHFPFTQVQAPVTGEQALLSRADILRWHKAILLKEHLGCELLIALLNHILERRQDVPGMVSVRGPAFTLGDVDKILWRMVDVNLTVWHPFSRGALCRLESIYQSQGQLLALEIGAWARWRRTSAQLSLVEMRRQSGLSGAMLGAFETKGPGQRLTFNSLLALDCAFQADGRLIAFSWWECLERERCEQAWRSIPSPYSLEGKWALFDLLISVERWLQVLYPHTITSWLSLLRGQPLAS